jgi:hypothetical protein
MAAEKFTGEVYRLIGQIADRTERISGYTGRVPLIEVDLALDEIRKLYDCFLLLRGSDLFEAERDSSGDIRGPEPVEVEEEILRDGELDGESVEPSGPSVVVAEVPATTDKPGEAVSEVSAGETKGEPAGVEVVSGVLSEEPFADPVLPRHRQEGSGSHRTIIGDKLISRDKQSIHDLIAAKRSDKSISSRIQHNPISNLKHAIGLNEKFIFVYELFGGNAQEYAAAIDRLNSMPGREEAIGLMESMREQYHWDIENMAFQKLVDMVARRYN